MDAYHWILTDEFSEWCYVLDCLVNDAVPGEEEEFFHTWEADLQSGELPVGEIR